MQCTYAAIVALSAQACLGVERPDRTVVFASGADLESANPLVTIHPLSRQVQRHVLFLTLVRYDSLLQPSPYLASRWQFSSDRRVLEFTLIPDSKWHDGNPTTAKDAAWTINAARNAASGYPRAADLASVSAAAAPNDSTLVVSFSAPQGLFPLVLCELPILPEHLLRDVPINSMRAASFSFNPVGNGPFRFAERRAGRRWVFERNENFPASLGGPPGIDRFVIAVVDEATTKFAGLVSGELDVAGIAPTMADLAARDPRLRVLSYPLMLANGVVFNVHRPPFDDIRVRRAVSLSINRKRLVDVALAGFGLPSGSAVVPDNPLAVIPDVVVDTAMADSLLDAAGWTRGQDGVRRKGAEELEFELLAVVTANNEMEQLIQSDLSARGIRMRIRGLEFASFLAQARQRPKTFDAIVTGIPGDVSLAYLAAMFDGSLAGGALDYADFHTPVLDSLFRRTRLAATTQELMQRWSAVQSELHASHPVAWLYHSRGVQGLSRRLGGVSMDLRGELTTVRSWTTNGGGSRTRTQ